MTCHSDGPIEFANDNEKWTHIRKIYDAVNVREVEQWNYAKSEWTELFPGGCPAHDLLTFPGRYRIKPEPPRRVSFMEMIAIGEGTWKSCDVYQREVDFIKGTNPLISFSRNGVSSVFLKSIKGDWERIA